MSTFANHPKKPMELEQELVQALRPLALGSVPASAISSLFDTGGTAAVRDDWCESVTRRQLRALDKVFTKYRQRAGADEHLWQFFVSNEAIHMVVQPQAGSENRDAVYRSLLSLLQAIVNVREVYAQASDIEKRTMLSKALVAAKVYLTWLQLPGGAAYGLFMAYVYRQVLDTLKKWVILLTRTESRQKGTKEAPCGRNERQVKARKEPRSDDDQDDDSDPGDSLVTAYGLELMDMLVLFLGKFSLAASDESMVATLETIIAVQTAVVPEHEGTAAMMTAKTVQMVEALMNGVHGEPLEIARMILHCYIPGVTFQETIAKENRASLRFHKLAMDMILKVQHLVASGWTDDDGQREHSLLLLGVIQNICLQAPGLADDRQRVLSFVRSLAVAGRCDCNDAENVRPSALRDEEWVRLMRFLASYSRNAKLKYRQFAVELLSRFVVETRLWTVNERELSQALVPYAGVGPLLEVLIDRARDKVAQVRTKAITGISALLTLGLSTVAHGNDADADNAMTGSETSASSLPKLLYASSVDEHGVPRRENSQLMERLVALFRERLRDEKTFVRKAAVHALEALIVAHSGDTVLASSRQDLFDIQARCTDSSVIVRVQSIKSLSAIVLTFPQHEEAQKLWNLGVLPLCLDPETSVQSCALEAANRVVFDRVLAWYDDRRNEAHRATLDCVWMQVAHLDGVMARCVQTALRMLMKSDKIDVRQLISTCIGAIQESVSAYNGSNDNDVHQATADDATRRLLTRYWGFSWIVLEELAHSSHLVETVQEKQQSLGIVVDCWNKLQDRALPMDYHDGSKRILRVIAALATVLDAQDAQSIADGLLASLHAFAIPLNVIADGILTLYSICKAKAPSLQTGREISVAWATTLLQVAERNLRQCFTSRLDSVDDKTVLLLQKQLISIGDVALLEFDKDADKSGDAALVPIRSSLTSLVQLFLPPAFVPTSLAMSQAAAHLDETDTRRWSKGDAVPLPTPVRVCAFVTLGKLCLRDSDLAKHCMTMLIRELRTCDQRDIRSNILLILGDLCIRYTSLVDAYVPTMVLSLLDKSRLLRRNTLLLVSQLILQDYIKWRESLLRFFLRAAVDDDEEVANLARHVLCGPLLQKSPHLFTTKFIEMIFVLNGIEGSKMTWAEPVEAQITRELALLGDALYPRRATLYCFLLEHMSDEQKLQVAMKLCTDVLEEVMDGSLPLCENPSEITDCCTEAVLKDTFAILSSSAIKLTSSKAEDEDGDDATAADAGNVASQLAAAKGKLLSKLSKKNFLENVVPVLIGLKHTLEAKHSPLTRALLYYIRDLFHVYRQDVKNLFASTDPQMALEVEYDLRQVDLQQEQRALDNAATLARAPSPLQEGVVEPRHVPLRFHCTEKLAPRRRRHRQLSAFIRDTTVSSEKLKSVSTRQGKSKHWHVTAQSPVGDKTTGRSPTPEALDGQLQPNFNAAIDETSDGEARGPLTVNTSRQRAKAKTRCEEEASGVLPVRKRSKTRTVKGNKKL